MQSHELCYAVSTAPDADYRFGGTLIDIGDVFLHGRTEEQAVNALGNTHGSIECCNGQWYVFYHRQTNRTNYSRQGCAEKITIASDGSIAQAAVSSCGLNQGPLQGEGFYPAFICCHLTAEKGAAFSHPDVMKMDYPYLTQDCGDLEPEDVRMEHDSTDPVQYVRNIRNGATVGFKSFAFSDLTEIEFALRGSGSGAFEVRTQLQGEICGSIPVEGLCASWKEKRGQVNIPDGVSPLYFTYRGSDSVDLKGFRLVCGNSRKKVSDK